MVKANLSEDTVIATPLRNVITIIGAVAVGTWAYFGLIERLNSIETNITLMTTDLEKNTEFRIKWPRGEMGSLPADSEQYMLIEHIAGQVESVQKQMEDMMNNGVNIKRLQEDVKILREDVEELKDSNRNIIYQNGNNGNGKTQ